MIKLFTDSDLDGLGCGVLAKLAFKQKADVSYCTYRNLNQRVTEFIGNPEYNNEQVYITDLAVNDQVEKRLAERHNAGYHIQVIDHHVTALHFNNYPWGSVQVEYEDKRKTSATSLFYDFLVSNNHLQPTKAIDAFVDLVRQYDTWEWDANNNLLAKKLNDLFGMFGRDRLEGEVLERLKSNHKTFKLTDNEEMILDIEEKKIERYINSKSRQTVQTFIDNYCIGIVHSEQYHSELGNALNKKYPHLDMITIVNGGTKKMGFRTIHDHVDVSAFAGKFGGGGHPKASGCELNDETFEKFVVSPFHIPPLKPDPELNELNVKKAQYGSRYMNRKGDITVIKPIDNKWEVIHTGKKIEHAFDTYEEAENYIKRHYMSWLMFDQDLIKNLAPLLAITTEELQNRFYDIMQSLDTELELTKIKGE